MAIAEAPNFIGLVQSKSATETAKMVDDGIGVAPGGAITGEVMSSHTDSTGKVEVFDGLFGRTGEYDSSKHHQVKSLPSDPQGMIRWYSPDPVKG